MEKFNVLKAEVIEKFNDGVLIRVIGHFPNCFNQTYFIVSFYDNIDFYYRSFLNAHSFLHLYSKHHTKSFYRHKLSFHTDYATIKNLLFSDSINKVRIEHADPVKLFEFLSQFFTPESSWVMSDLLYDFEFDFSSSVKSDLIPIPNENCPHELPL